MEQQQQREWCLDDPHLNVRRFFFFFCLCFPPFAWPYESPWLSDIFIHHQHRRPWCTFGLAWMANGRAVSKQKPKQAASE